MTMWQSGLHCCQESVSCLQQGFSTPQCVAFPRRQKLRQHCTNFTAHTYVQQAPIHGSHEEHHERHISSANTPQQPTITLHPLPVSTCSVQQPPRDHQLNAGQENDFLSSQLQGHTLPQHIAVIMDGNARWAKQRGLPVTAGHQAGAACLQQLVRDCRRLSIPALTVYAFSAENWKRPAAEVTFLLRLFEQSIDEHLEELHTQGVRLMFIGQRHTLPASLLAKMDSAEQRTCDNTQLLLSVAVSYSARDDLSQAARRIASLAAQGLLDPDKVDASLLESHLSTAEATAQVGPPDLLIRTSGEHRLSNFMLFEMAYCELYFATCLWPDFGSNELLKALLAFSKRQRRFGKRTF